MTSASALFGYVPKFGRDEHSRYIAVRGKHFAVEPFPYWGPHPAYPPIYLWTRIETVCWHISRLTGLRWEGQ